MQIDPELAPILAKAAEVMTKVPPRGDALALRQTVESRMKEMTPLMFPKTGNVTYIEATTTSRDGATVDLRWYTKTGSSATAAIVYIHGGGMVMGSIDIYDPIVTQYVEWTGVAFLAVEYRLAPECTDDILAEDSFAGLAWLVGHGSELGIDPTRIAIMGDSGGGGVAAGAAILARDRGIDLKRQILIYPMLDDQNTKPDPHLVPTMTWSYDQNYTGWSALMGDSLGAKDASAIAAPARNRNFKGLAPAYIEVGELDIFRDESIEYARNLLTAGVSTELHVLPGAPHGHDWLGLGTTYVDRWKGNRLRAILDL
jgi:acetyl esterase/lipase